MNAPWASYMPASQGLPVDLRRLALVLASVPGEIDLFKADRSKVAHLRDPDSHLRQEVDVTNVHSTYIEIDAYHAARHRQYRSKNNLVRDVGSSGSSWNRNSSGLNLAEPAHVPRLNTALASHSMTCAMP